MTTDVPSDRATSRASRPPVDHDGRGSRLHGVHDREFDAAVRAFDRLYGGRRQGGASFVVLHRGRTVVDVWKGYADRGARRPWTRDTPAIAFSATKGVAATVIHRLVDRGLIDVDDPVAEYWPAFAAEGKDRITVRQLLSHRAGLQSLRSVAPRADDVLDHVAMEERLAAGRPDRAGGRPAYHAWTFGWLLAGLARQVTGKGMEELFHDELAVPLGIEDGFGLGRSREGRTPTAELVPVNIQRASGPLSAVGTTVVRRLRPLGRAIDPMLVPQVLPLFAGDAAPILATESPAVNGTFSAAALARIYGALDADRDGERRLLSAHTVRELGRVQDRRRDEVLQAPMRWRLGYHQAIVLDRGAGRAFGHVGLGGTFAWTDPTLDLTCAFVTNRMPTAATPLGRGEFVLLGTLVHAAARRAAARA
ncbi:MAG: beta-lactamase family protein [Solirubrobacteraceae bacterium]|nr:beta-lactamase family protein [Solirubrobacteraceae bacterium]